MTKEAQQNGKNAENRVRDLALRIGMDARLATPTEDYSQKTDVVVDGIPIQVSVSRKSRNQRKLLERSGIKGIEAGEELPDESVIAQILRALGR
jgi:hypothetical protein